MSVRLGGKFGIGSKDFLYNRVKPACPQLAQTCPVETGFQLQRIFGSRNTASSTGLAASPSEWGELARILGMHCGKSGFSGGFRLSGAFVRFYLSRYFPNIYM